MRTAREGAAALRVALLAHGGTLAQSLHEHPVGELDAPGPPQLAAGGPRCEADAGEYELLLEMILEGSRLHYGQPRLIDCPDADLALLLGDQLYALGLMRLARVGDLDAVAELADVISLVAQAHSGSHPELGDAVWEAGAVAIGWGPTDAHRTAKELARTQRPEALSAMREAARGPLVDSASPRSGS
ncbi:MAG: hypothetical protein M3076_03450 [Actinomycetota bacterium]|nr:hypothetical protein [Actinomycetota bacterium]